MVGTGRGAQLGILVDGPAVLERAHAGSIRSCSTRRARSRDGPHGARRRRPLNGATRGDVLRLAGAVETASEHPIAQAVAAAARAELGELPSVSGFRNVPGVGVDRPRRGPRGRGRRARAARSPSAGTALPRATLVVRDTVKPTSAEAVRELRALGLTPVLLTGDSEETARARRRRGRDRARARRGAARRQGRRGAPAPGGRARSSQWSGTASTTRRRSPRPISGSRSARAPTSPSRPRDLTLVSGDLEPPPTPSASHAARSKTIKGNLFWAFAYNVAAIPLAVAGLLESDRRRRRDGLLERLRRHEQPAAASVPQPARGGAPA